MDIVVPEDLEAKMKLTFDADTKVAVATILDGLEGELQAFLGRPLVPTQVEEEAARPEPLTGRLSLKKTPVASVSAFSIDGTAIDAADFIVRPWGIESVSAVILAPVSLSTSEPVILVSYVGGLPGNDPDDDFTRTARQRLLDAAARDLNHFVREDAAGTRTLSVEGTSIAWSTDGGLTDEDRRAMSRWKKRTVR